MKERILSLLESETYIGLDIDKISQTLSLVTPEEFTQLVKALNELDDECLIVQSKKGKFFKVGTFGYNVGVINLIPFPAFDGGRVLFLIIEKIRRKPIKAKTEAIVNTVGFGLLILLMIVVTIGDIIKLF